MGSRWLQRCVKSFVIGAIIIFVMLSIFISISPFLHLSNLGKTGQANPEASRGHNATSSMKINNNNNITGTSLTNGSALSVQPVHHFASNDGRRHSRVTSDGFQKKENQPTSHLQCHSCRGYGHIAKFCNKPADQSSKIDTVGSATVPGADHRMANQSRSQWNDSPRRPNMGGEFHGKEHRQSSLQYDNRGDYEHTVKCNKPVEQQSKTVDTGGPDPVGPNQARNQGNEGAQERSGGIRPPRRATVEYYTARKCFTCNQVGHIAVQCPTKTAK